MLPTFDPGACLATPWQATPDLPLRVLIATGLTALAGWAGARRRFPGQRAFVALVLVMAGWLGAAIAEHAAVEAGCKATLALLSWLAIAAQPLVYALFLVQYLNSELHGGPWRSRLLLAAPSAVLAALALGNGWHGLFYGPDTHLTAPIAGMPRLRYDYGPLFYATVLLGYAWLTMAAAMVIRAWARSRGAQRRQWAFFLVMMAVPLAANAAYLGAGVRLLGADPTPTAFAVTLAGFAWLTARDQLFAAVPLARRLLFEELPDPVLVLDAHGRIAEANRAALQLQPPPPLDQPLSAWPRFGPGLARPDPAPLLTLADPPAWYEVHRRALGTPATPLGALLQLHDVSERHQAHEATARRLAARERELDQATALQALLRQQAMHDALTGLLNRRALDERFALAAADPDAPLSLVLMDLDHFKRINDTHGHAVGDAVLRDFASALRSGLRSDDALFRIGGEEFALLLPGASASQALARTETLRALVARWRLGQLAEPVGFSAGVAARSHTRQTLSALLEAADGALYAAKRAGRGRTEVAPAA
jgi:diguanylate cyclase (GGDEF)-like protein